MKRIKECNPNTPSYLCPFFLAFMAALYTSNVLFDPVPCLIKFMELENSKEAFKAREMFRKISPQTKLIELEKASSPYPSSNVSPQKGHISQNQNETILNKNEKNNKSIKEDWYSMDTSLSNNFFTAKDLDVSLNEKDQVIINSSKHYENEISRSNKKEEEEEEEEREEVKEEKEVKDNEIIIKPLIKPTTWAEIRSKKKGGGSSSQEMLF